jgi:Domain of unknown function (DUF4258)
MRERRPERPRAGVKELLQALSAGQILEDYPDDQRGPRSLVLGQTLDGRALHVVWAFDSGAMRLPIMVYELELPWWLSERLQAPGRRGL